MIVSTPTLCKLSDNLVRSDNVLRISCYQEKQKNDDDLNSNFSASTLCSSRRCFLFVLDADRVCNKLVLREVIITFETFEKTLDRVIKSNRRRPPIHPRQNHPRRTSFPRQKVYFYRFLGSAMKKKVR